MPFIIWLFALVFLIVASPLDTGGRSLSFQVGPNLVLESSLLEIEKTTTLDLTLVSSARGLAGFDIDIEIASPSLIQITGVTFPSFGLTDIEGLNTPTVSIAAVDLAEIATGALSNFRLATVTVLGLEAGEAVLTLTVNAIDDDQANPIAVDPLPARVRTAPVDFPSDLDTEVKRLNSTIAVLERMRIQHNVVGEIVRGDLDQHIGRFQTYRELFLEKQSPLLAEYRRLKLAVRREIFTDEQWGAKTDQEKNDLYESLYGDKDVQVGIPTLATSRLLTQLEAVDFLLLTGDYVDPIEDWTDTDIWPETDTSGVIAPSTTTPGVDSTITVTNLTRSSDSWIVFDAGVDFFETTGIDHDISSEGTDFDGNNPSIFFWGLSNVSDPEDVDDPIIQVRMQDRSGTNMRYRIIIDDGATEDDDQGTNKDLATQYWLTITREAAGSIALIYDDSARTSLIDTITVSQGSSDFRYIATGFSRNGSGSQVSNGFIYDLDLTVPVADDRRRLWVVSQRQPN